MPYATVTSKGQITIPIEVRNELGLKPGDRIEFYKSPGDHFTMIAKNKSIKRLKGILGKSHRDISIEEMNEAIARSAAGIPEPEKQAEIA